MSILVTRPSPAGEELVSRLRTLGQVAWHFPLIEFSPGRQLPQLADQLAALGESDLLFALSQHAVAFAQSQLHQQVAVIVDPEKTQSAENARPPAPVCADGSLTLLQRETGG